MSDPITVRIFRYDPDRDQAPYYKKYQVSADEKTTVLMLLDRLYKEQDPTLGFRSYCCGLQTCRSCLMKINGKRKFACLTLVGPGEEVILEPLSYPERHIKDLVTRIK